MKVTAIKTEKVLPHSTSLFQLVDSVIKSLNERSILVITSKVVSLCENQVLPVEGTDRDALIRAESDFYHEPADAGELLYHFTIKQDTLIPAAGIDVSNANGNYVLWPRNSVTTANNVRAHLMDKFSVKELGVIITDSTIGLSRWGTLGIAIGHSGFGAVKNYIGQSDLFGREMHLSKANIAGGLASSAVVAMGEGAEQTPIAVIEDIPFVEFQSNDATKTELAEYYVSPLKDEPFMPFFRSGDWQRGGKVNTPSSTED